MPQVRLLKIGSTGLATEMDQLADDITLASFTVASGGPTLNGTTLDMNNRTITDVDLLSFTDPTADGITQTVGLLVADNIMGKDRSNSMTATSDILFPTVTNTSGQLDCFRLPQVAGTPTATPTVGGEGHIVWDSTNNLLYVWDGSAWNNSFINASTASGVTKTYTAASGGVTIRDVVTVNGIANEVAPADANAESTSRVVGFAVATTAAGNPVSVQCEGILSGFTGLTSGARYFLSETTGAITTVAPTTASANVIQVGYARSSSTLDIQIVPIAIRAA